MLANYWGTVYHNYALKMDRIMKPSNIHISKNLRYINLRLRIYLFIYLFAQTYYAHNISFSR